MSEEELKKIKIQHIDNYKKAILENIKNNTNVLVDEDIKSLLKTPPLDSMDLIKAKFLDLAKKNKIILNTDELKRILDNYRKYIMKCCNEIKTIRVSELSSKVESIEFVKNSDIIKINEKDFSNINKWYDKGQLLSYKAFFNMLIGNRGGGKTGRRAGHPALLGRRRQAPCHIGCHRPNCGDYR